MSGNGISDGELQAIKDSVKTEVIVVQGQEYATRAVVDVRKADPEPKYIALNTLSGFVDYINGEYLGQDKRQNGIIHIANHCEVRLASNLYGTFKQRDFFAIAKFEDLFGSGFKFGAWTENENFIIALQTLFKPTIDRASILSLVGNIKEEDVATHNDDGITQTVTAQKGISLQQQLPVPNPVKLQPFRTFREIEQPESGFVLRMKQNPQGGKPLCALFESDGGLWKLEAIASIREYIAAQHFTIPIVS